MSGDNSSEPVIQYQVYKGHRFEDLTIFGDGLITVDTIAGEAEAEVNQKSMRVQPNEVSQLVEQLSRTLPKYDPEKEAKPTKTGTNVSLTLPSDRDMRSAAWSSIRPANALYERIAPVLTRIDGWRYELGGTIKYTLSSRRSSAPSQDQQKQ